MLLALLLRVSDAEATRTTQHLPAEAAVG